MDTNDPNQWQGAIVKDGMAVGVYDYPGHHITWYFSPGGVWQMQSFETFTGDDAMRNAVLYLEQTGFEFLPMAALLERLKHRTVRPKSIAPLEVKDPEVVDAPVRGDLADDVCRTCGDQGKKVGMETPTDPDMAAEGDYTLYQCTRDSSHKWSVFG